MKSLLHNKIFWILLAIVIVGAFLRLYHFNDWMHYELDQARDYKVIHAAMEYGPAELPLQGPRAAGSFLRLGPLFYYMEYGSALLFGDSPQGSVVIIVFLSILTIPLFFLFARRYFSNYLSLGLTAIIAASLFMVVYSRFGWNPNTLPFFSLAFVYALLRATDVDEERKGWWLIGASAALAFLSNLHFLAFIAAPLIGLVYLGITRPRITLVYWISAVLLFLFLNTPLIVNDVKTGGENVQAFFAAITDKGGDGDDEDVATDKKKDDDHSLIEKTVKNVGWVAKYNWLLFTGDQNAELPTVKGLDIRCDHDCRNGIVRGGISLVFIIGGAVALIILWRREKDPAKRQFLLLNALWMGIIFIAYIPLAYKLAPRFFLLLVPSALILCGLLLQVIVHYHPPLKKVVAYGLIMFSVLANLYFVSLYFSQLSRAASDTTLVIPTDRILREKTRTTISQMTMIVDHMERVHRENGEPIFMHGQPEFKRPFWERIDQRNIPRDHIPKDLEPMYREGNYFVVLRTQSDQESNLEKFTKGMDIIDVQEFGTLTLYQLKPREEYISDDRAVFEEKSRDPVFSHGVQPRYLWRHAFDGCVYEDRSYTCARSRTDQ